MSKLPRLGATPALETFGGYLATNREAMVKAVRAGSKKKDTLPALLPAGVFRGGYQIKDFVRPSGLASFDIDHVDDAGGVRDKVASLPFVYYSSTSVSGEGVWGLVKFASPTEYLFQYSALIEAFAEEGLGLDMTGANINRLRYYSWDPDARLNEKSDPFKKLSSSIRTKDGVTPDFSPQRGELTSGQAYWIKSFDRQYTCEGLLLLAGWDVKNPRYDGRCDVARPGTEKFSSGNIKDNKLWVWTDATAFAQHTLNSPFDCYAALFHNGDIPAAVIAVKRGDEIPML